MSTVEKSTAIDARVMADLQAAADRAASGARDREAMRRAAERMDRTRAQIARGIGRVDFAVPTIRALRDGDS